MHTCIRACMNTCLHAYMPACIYTYTHTKKNIEGGPRSFKHRPRRRPNPNVRPKRPQRQPLINRDSRAGIRRGSLSASAQCFFIRNQCNPQ